MECRRDWHALRGGVPLNATGLLLGLAILVCGGCGTVQPVAEAEVAGVGEVGASLILPPAGAATLELKATERFVYPNLIEPAALPAYPPELLPRRLPPVEICVEVDIGADGQVTAARQRVDETCPAGEHRVVGDMAVATLAAVRRWHFDPAYLCRAPAGFAGDDPCLAEDASEHPTPVRLSYAFRFSQHDGRALVERSD